MTNLNLITLNQETNNSPLDQFAIRNLFSIDAPILGDASISLTNIGLYLTISTIILLNLYLVSNNYNSLLFINLCLHKYFRFNFLYSIPLYSVFSDITLYNI